MARADWRSASAYENLGPLDAPAFAFEFLRRNRDFLNDYAQLARLSHARQLDAAAADAFAERWGLHFRAEFTHAVSNIDPVDRKGTPQRRHSHKHDRRTGRS